MSVEAKFYECLKSKITTTYPIVRWGVGGDVAGAYITIRTRTADGSCPPGYRWFEVDLICVSNAADDTDKAKLDELMEAVEGLNYTEYSHDGITIVGDVALPEAAVRENELEQANHIKAVSKRLAVFLG